METLKAPLVAICMFVSVWVGRVSPQPTRIASAVVVAVVVPAKSPYPPPL